MHLLVINMIKFYIINMKLFIDCRMLGSGGIGTYLESILPYLLLNNECTLLCFPSQTQKLTSYTENKNCNIIETEIPTFSIKELLFFPSSLRKVINSCDAYYSPYCNVPSGIKIPVFTTIHDVVFLDIAGLSSKLGTIARKFFYQHAINRSKTVFTVSKFSADRIAANLKTKKTKIVITYNSVPQWFTEKNASAQPVSKDNSILFVGNIKKHKGLTTLLEAFSTCIKDGLDAKLVIVGNADNFRSGDTQIAEKLSSLSDSNIIFTGKISDEELKNYYQKARLLVQPSLYEGFGMPPMEALVSGTNVILTDIPVFKEIYEGFPVTFFESQNSTELAEKIKQHFDDLPPVSIPKKYSFEAVSNIILNELNS